MFYRFYYQIRYGCQNPRCQTPTCLNYERRKLDGTPFRIPTATTARALAEFLIGLDNPLAKLCQHPPVAKADADDFAVPSLETLPLVSQAVSTGQEHVPESQSPWKDRSEPSVKDGAEPRGVKLDIMQESHHGEAVSDNQTYQPAPEGLARNSTTGGRQRERIDAKSLVQVLFNTSAWKFSKAVETSGGLYRLVSGFDQRRNHTQGGLQDVNRVLNDTRSNLNAPAAIAHESLGATQHDPKRNVWSSKRPKECSTHPDIVPILTWRQLNRVLPGLEDNGSKKVPEQHGHQLFERTTPFDPDKGTLSLQAPDLATNLEGGAMALVLEVLDSSELLKGSFIEDMRPGAGWDDYKTIGIKEMCTSFLIFYANEDHPRSILPSLWRSLSKAYRNLGAVASAGQEPDYDDREAAHLINIGLGALLARVFIGDASVEPDAWATFRTLKAYGRFLPSEHTKDVNVRRQVITYISIFEDELALRLMKRVLRAFASRSYRSQPSKSPSESAHRMDDFTLRVLQFLASDADHSRATGRIVLEWARTIFQKEWNNEAEFTWSSDAGCALEFMRVLYDNMDFLQLEPADFAMPFLFKRLDFLEIPIQWLHFKRSANRAHMLDFPWLFPAPVVVTYYRAINYSSMFNAFAKSVSISTMVMRLSMLAGLSHRSLLDRLTRATISYLVLEIRREKILEDALDQLWRRQKKELYRPLKIRMGIDEGEEGVDLGGVQQEFFRLALGQALDPDFGLFTVDEVTRMVWFVPNSKSPLHYYVLVGLLMGLAVYNGITLPVTFPSALYRKLQGWPAEKLDDISDGWPVLAKGLRALLDWKEGDVEDVFMRSYVFSGDSDGCPFHVDMSKHPRDQPWPVAAPTATGKDPISPDAVSGGGSSPDWQEVSGPSSQANGASQSSDEAFQLIDTGDDDAPMVTNRNREDYVRDYIFWLTDKSIRPQYEALATGFFLPLNRTSLQLFTPRSLRDLVEGFQDIDLDGLERVTKYENGFGADHPLILDFWRIVRNFSPDELRRLLEFVTASDRVPVKGVEEMMFLIQRNGNDDERLPTSMTCFGRLLLPEYSSREKLEEKLRHAIENSQGFGVA